MGGQEMKIDMKGVVSGDNLKLSVDMMGQPMEITLKRADEGPTVVGVPGSPVLLLSNFDLGSLGYTTEEFFISGKASSYKLEGAQTPDGRWNVKVSESAPYTTRIVAVRPTDSKKFNGTVVVEWLNVSAGTDASPDWNAMHREILRGGYAYVGVSAQKVGVEGGGFSVVAIAIENLMDIDAIPWQADWYRTKVHEAGRAKDFRLYYIDPADHVGRPNGTHAARLVDYSGALQQALRDLSAWVEKGVQPPEETRYKIMKSQVAVPATAIERKGIQPVIELKANGGQRAEVAVSQAAPCKPYHARTLIRTPVSARRWFRMLGEKGIYAWQCLFDDGAMAYARHFVIFVSHVQFFEFINPLPGIGNRNHFVGIAMCKDNWHAGNRF
jgi:hypothetical protein